MATRRKITQTTEETTNPLVSRKDFINSVIKKKQKNKFLSEHQEEYYNILKNNQINVASGPAGVDKSYIVHSVLQDKKCLDRIAQVIKKTDR